MVSAILPSDMQAPEDEQVSIERLAALRTILRERARTAKAAAHEPGIDPRREAALRGKSRGLAEAASALDSVIAGNDSGRGLHRKEYRRRLRHLIRARHQTRSRGKRNT